jgi:hypothetical protein
VLYTSLTKEGALAEIGFRLSLEPVWPSKLDHQLHEISVEIERALTTVDVPSLLPFGIDAARYESFDYQATQALAAAAHFLEFDGLLVPSARAPCSNLVLFQDRISGSAILEVMKSVEVDWDSWRLSRAARR